MTNQANSSTYHLSRIKAISGIRNTGFQIAGIKVSLDENIQYNAEGEKRIRKNLDYFALNTGYMMGIIFNMKKEQGKKGLMRVIITNE